MTGISNGGQPGRSFRDEFDLVGGGDRIKRFDLLYGGVQDVLTTV
jgi:hypothetical protein